MVLKTAYIGLGSNLGDSLRILRDAWQELGRQPDISLGPLSSPYRSEPVGMVSAHWFINGVGQLRTSLPPLYLLHRLLVVEQRFGRQREQGAAGYQDRTLDLDLLLYDDLLLSSEHLVLPHPELHRRTFVLLPLCELAPDRRHPLLGRTMRELLASRQAEPDRPQCARIAWPPG